MKKISIIFFSVFYLWSFGQHSCGFDFIQGQIEKEYPSVRQKTEEMNSKILGMNVNKYLNSMGATSKNGLYTGTIYEIPVVVHVIQSTAASNSAYALTDAQIQTWIDNANKMYATTYGNGFYTEGTGNTGGTVIPFKLMLAKRSPQCTATTGIVRYNGSTISGYDTNGVSRDATQYPGVSMASVRTLAPHWPESSYFNIYVVVGLEGVKVYNGLLGWCAFPTTIDPAYESVMKVAVIKQTDDTTLAHEFGHGLGLYHPFGNTDPYDTNPATACPTNANCQTDNDMVCDTAPVMSLMTANPTPTDSQVNGCTNANYDGTQYNIMGYAITTKKFTPGQRDRALAMFLTLRGNLTSSLGATDPTITPAPIINLVAASCNPTSVTTPGDYNVGPTSVKFGTVNNQSTGYLTSMPYYYVDYTANICLNKGFYTDISSSIATSLQVTTVLNNQKLMAWIDYNNNGTFETSEVVANQVVVPGTATISVTPPAGVVKNTYLRMRVAADGNNSLASCGTYAYGQAEDYAVRILDNLGTVDVTNQDTKLFVVYSKNDNKLTLVTDKKNKIFGDYQIFDLSGKLIQKGNSKTNEIRIEWELAKGAYIVTFANDDGQVSKKFLNN